MSKPHLPVPDEFVRVVGDVKLAYSRQDVNLNLTTTADMSQMAAETAKEVARYTHAVPAQEATKRTQSETRRFAIALVAVVAGIVAACIKPEAAASVAAMVCIFGAGIAAPSIIERAKTKPRE